MRYRYLLVLSGLVACHHNPDVQPIPVPSPDAYDVLARQVGHWQWDHSIVPFQGEADSALVRHGRQLVFRADSTVLLRRTNRPDTAAAYHFSAAIPRVCMKSPVRFVAYDTREPAWYTNGGRKVVSLGTRSAHVQTLSLASEGACVDVGPTEIFHWVPKK